MDIGEQLQQLTERLDALEAENRHLRSVVQQHHDAAADEPADAPMSRRTWLARGAAVAAGAVAGGLAFASPAAAVGEMFLNVNNAGTATTKITASLGADIFTSVINGTNNAVQGAGLFGYGASYGTLGFSSLGTGVWGKASGVYGTPAVGTGGYIDNPDSPFSIGVLGEASGDDQIGVKGVSNLGYGGAFESDYADLFIGQPVRGAPTEDGVNHHFAEMVAQNGNFQSTLWYCTRSGIPGTWRRLAAPNSMGATTLFDTPVRVYDSRPAKEPLDVLPKLPLATDADRVVDCTLNDSKVPVDAVAVLINLTAANQSGGGYLSVRSKGFAYHNTSNLNWTAAGQTIANFAMVKCGTGATITVRLGGAASAHVIVDVIGYML
ncbi:MAG: hypothetical protein ABMA25_14230 [Ilumatobacteraceae bacterium]